MSRELARRVNALEVGGSSAMWGKVHQLRRGEGQTIEQAMDAYGRDRIGPNDLTIVQRIISPSFDADGNMIPRTDGRATRRSGIGAPSHD